MIDNCLQEIESISSSDLYLYFITRTYKPDVKRSSKVLEKYNFKAYQVDINDEIRDYLYSLTQEQLQHTKKKDLEITEYDVISDDIESIFTYQINNKAMSFASVINDQLPFKSKIPKIKNLEEIIESEDLWAYCVGFDLGDEKWFYTFRKIASGRVAIDEKEGAKKSKIFRTIFNTESSKLELIKGQTINLDKQIDCIYINDTFYVLKKTLFEQIIGLAEEFKERAAEVVLNLEATQMLEGISLLKECVQKNPAIHKKLVRLQKLDNFKNLDKPTLDRLIDVAKRFGDNIKRSEDGKLLLEDEKDINMAIKMLCDYYKEGSVFGKHYGTFSGKLINPIQ